LPHPDADELNAIASGARDEESRDAGETDRSLFGGPSPVPTQGGQPAQAGKPSKRIVIDLGAQTATAMENGKAVKTMPISSGKKGHETTPGHFKITERDKDHMSSTYGKCVSGKSSRNVSKGAKSCKKGEKYEGAPMNFFQRFNGTEGLHQGLLPGHPDSHGCVRLGKGNAEWLWNWAEVGTPVDVAVPAKKAPAKSPRGKK
jgi:lipoprotein-anchoring transpeptidase ErfK/SrfK